MVPSAAATLARLPNTAWGLLQLGLLHSAVQLQLASKESAPDAAGKSSHAYRYPDTLFGNAAAGTQ